MELNKLKVSSLMDITARPDLVFLRGHGSWLEDSTGKKYLDFIQGWAVNSLGHSPKEVINALLEQSRLLINPSPAFYNKPSVELATSLVEASCFDHVFFANSGAEANEGAIKLARKWGKIHKKGAYKIITMKDSFHGRTLATMSASGKDGWDNIFPPRMEGFIKADLNNIESVKELIDDDVVAIMLEPIQGEAGVIPADKKFMQDLRNLADYNNLLLIVDEVQTGMGRTGTLFAYQQYDLVPDIMTLGKGIGGGVPLSALLARNSVCVFSHGDQGGTYNGNPLCTAVGLSVLNAINNTNFMESVVINSGFLSKGLSDLSDKYGMNGERGMGFLRALILNSNDAPAIVELARNSGPVGLILNAPRSNLLRFMPALNISRDEISLMLEMLDSFISKILKR
ncbi:acetylornithine/N-succinyldiaminopimelate aminotransferase [Candidatus Kinetoplastibacterium blastocrithidii TCC012E]|uniref:Diaminobutyrate--2-oxoglutarate transaminase n=1 Tax=Candidatus Kinetoplastidibacterium blastocrithidiae TCC012E TaxID=1208922 RepID=M1M2N5_9PROT|nr:acetylornithine transaminase [Candidatus Kinetoplastibacterium blastocrithidii]AFZ83361.1 acetylornithine/N-succinyldiaminopimelate aminotransferase [Candidatus Kinetoplastibacterium blastocrithidii (ex Strigomonas culicis)]AGF49459.1 acetylornithine/N-succinyldiaminopimelate aminotransferase [Candidatus Kinetoplastibacterium blastocrithidii TCC012E]